MDEKHEVEYRALITLEVFEKLINKGKNEFPESFKGPLIIHDAYFCQKNIKDFHEVEMDKIGSYSLRLRREIKNETTTITINTKTIRNEGDHNAWLENEVNISSFEECKKILETIGFKIFFELKKNRFSFQDGEISVCLEDIDGFRPAIEVEIITSPDKTIEAKNKLLDYFFKNQIEKKAIVEKSITNFLMRKKASF